MWLKHGHNYPLTLQRTFTIPIVLTHVNLTQKKTPGVVYFFLHPQGFISHKNDYTTINIAIYCSHYNIHYENADNYKKAVKILLMNLPKEKNLRRTSRDLLKIYKFALSKGPNKLIRSSEFGKILQLKGRSLGGVLAGSSKSEYDPIILQQGTISRNQQGNYIRPEILWSLNPKIPIQELKRIQNTIEDMIL